MLSNRDNIQGFTNSGLNGPENLFLTKNQFIINANAETTVTFRFIFTQPIEINWGDGTKSTPTSNMNISKTYSSPFSGNITLTGGLFSVTQFTGTAGNWSFDVGTLRNVFFNLSTLILQGNNTTFGLISALPAGLTFFNNLGQNTTSGLISDLPAGLTFFNNLGQNTTSGLISDLPAGLFHYRNTGQNTTSGLISDLPTGITFYFNTGQNTTSGYTSKVWATNQENVHSRPVSGFGLTSSQVDQLLIDLSAVVTWVGVKTIDMRGNNGARTALSNPAVVTLTSNGVTVLTN